jgi:thioesterase domain-containing protein
MIPHSGGSNTCQDMNERFGVTANDSVLSLAALSFDLSVYDIFGVMATGGTLVMPDHRHKQDPEHWLELMETHNITVWNTAPPVMTMLLDYVASSFEARERFSRLAIRLVFLSGDFIPLSMASTLKQLLPDPHLRVYSLGGATEASIWSCYYPIEDVSSSWKSVPYGRALGNQKLFVLDADLQPVQDLVHGEICIAGAGLARGYWADEEKTGRAFVHSPALGERIYRTGDLGRFYPTGDVEILGRIDFQVKVNGFRVEIGEVEAAIKAVDRVKSAIAMPVGEKGMQQLACFIVCTDPEAAVDEAQKMEVLDSVHKGLQTRVPSYAIPKHMILLQQWPVSVSGKVDRQALKRHLTEHLEAHLQQGGAGAGPQHIEPRNETETRLRDIWEAVLGFSGFGVMDSFLDIGGSSINLLRMAYSVKDEFGQSVPMDVLAGCSSIAALASWLQRTDSVSQSLAGNSFSKVVPFNATGSMPPCFFVAPVSGSSLCYRRLADALGTEQPIIALSHTQVCQDVEQPSLEDIAADLVRAVLEHLDTLPEGRREAFSLGGWSMGGVLAFEMLFQLRKKGKRLAKVILVDSPAPAEGIAVIEDEALSLVQFANDLTALDHAAELPSATLLGLSDAPLQDMLIALQRLSAMPDAMSLAEFAADFDIYQRNLRALAAYRPVLESSSGSSPERVLLHLLRASETNAHLQAYPGHRYKDFGWGLIGSINSLSSMLQVQVCLQLYDGDHYTVVREAGAKAIGRIMTPLLADVGTRAVHPPALTNFHFWSGSGGLSRTLSQTRLSQSAQTRAPRPYVDTKDHTSFCVCTGTARSFDDDSVKCAQDAYGELVARSGRMPQLVLVTASPDVDAVQVVHSLQLMAPDARVQAVSSVSGAICNTGRAKLALLGITDPRGRIGLGFAEGASKSEEQARDAGRNAAKQAVQDGLRADKPDVVIVNGTPGHEEQVLAGIADVVGAVGVSVIGGSAAGDLASKSWWVASAHEQRVDISNDGVSVCMLWTSVKTAMVYSSCYEPSKYRGTVTKTSSHREIVEIDDQPANMVYREWLQAEADAAVGDSHGDCKHAAALSRLMHEDAASIGEQLFKVSTCRPFGTAAAAPQDSGDASEADFFQLMHPHSISTNGGITLFADVHEGQEVTLMTTSDSDLKRLVEGATGAPAVSDFCETLQGALAFYCAGCSMQIGSEQVDDVAKNLSTSLNGMPFMGVLPFGEQGMDGAGSVRHGNLMYSLLLFGKPKS